MEIDDDILNCWGFDYVTSLFETIYSEQTNTKHYEELIDFKFWGNTPLKGISIYDIKDYYYFVTYGFSELYKKESKNKDISGYGVEVTLRLKKINMKI